LSGLREALLRKAGATGGLLDRHKGQGQKREFARGSLCAALEGKLTKNSHRKVSFNEEWGNSLMCSP